MVWLNVKGVGRDRLWEEKKKGMGDMLVVHLTRMLGKWQVGTPPPSPHFSASSPKEAETSQEVCADTKAIINLCPEIITYDVAILGIGGLDYGFLCGLMEFANMIGLLLRNTRAYMVAFWNRELILYRLGWVSMWVPWDFLEIFLNPTRQPRGIEKFFLQNVFI